MSLDTAIDPERRFFAATYRWAARACAIAGFVAWPIARVELFQQVLVETHLPMYALWFLQTLNLVFFCPRLARRGPGFGVLALGWLAVIAGCTASITWLVYRHHTVAFAFFAAACGFAALALTASNRHLALRARAHTAVIAAAGGLAGIGVYMFTDATTQIMLETAAVMAVVLVIETGAFSAMRRAYARGASPVQGAMTLCLAGRISEYG